MKNIVKAVLLFSLLSFGFTHSAYASEAKKVEDYMPSLITKTPLEGRMLAIKIVRKTVGQFKEIQT